MFRIGGFSRITRGTIYYG